MSEQRPTPPTVFRVRNQDDVISQIDAVEDDDLASSFFGDSIDEVEGAATRMFDIGIRVVAGEEPPTPEAFGRSGTGGPAASGATLELPSDLADAHAQRAFILGGPAGLRG